MSKDVVLNDDHVPTRKNCLLIVSKIVGFMYI